MYTRVSFFGTHCITLNKHCVAIYNTADSLADAVTYGITTFSNKLHD